MALVEYELDRDIAVIRLNRPEKRNAMSDALLAALGDAVDRAATEAKVAVLGTTGANFCAGLDLAEQADKTVMQGVQGSRGWHAVFARIQRGAIPYVSALSGAVIGGGFELAAVTHIRVADPGTYFAMPEGQRGIFVGGGGSVNITRLLGVPRMTDMMLTGRMIGAADAERLGVVNYVSDAGAALPRAIEVAGRIAANAPLSNYTIINALQRIHDSGYDEGLFFESMLAALTQSTPEAIERMRAFVEKRAQRLDVPPGTKG
ncbi:MAG: crotonase/enoyl-CoA hydratase family protein [Rhizobiaceae bacterium]|nr:crotonase/enoyl-CoA hydratase family protein [Rhizobiaceae bacterium]